MLFVCPQNWHKRCFQFLVGLTMVPRENKSNPYAKFGGQTKSIMSSNDDDDDDDDELSLPFFLDLKCCCEQNMPVLFV